MKIKPWQWLLFGGAAFLAVRLLGKWQLWDKLDFTLSKVKPSTGFGGLYLDTTFKLDNKTDESLTINKIQGNILYDGKKVAAIYQESAQTIQPGISEFTVKIKPTLAGTVSTIQTFLQNPTAKAMQKFRFDGSVTVEGITAPINQQLEW